MTTYASVHLDGCLTCSTICAGILTTPTASTTIVNFQVLAGLQAHPVWALDRLAVVVFAFCRVASETSADIQVNVSGTLVSNDLISLTMADRVEWHTSRQIRTQAERLIAILTNGNSLPTIWPQENLRPPIQFDSSAKRARRIPDDQLAASALAYRR